MSRQQEHDDEHGQRDPLGLRGLPQIEPDGDGWPGIAAALAADRPQRRAPLGWLATAACLVLVAGALLHQRGEAPTGVDPALNGADTALVDAARGPEAGAAVTSPGDMQDDTDVASAQDLIVLSQLLERRLQGLRARTAGLPAESAMYVAELEDLVARVDSALSDTPTSRALWGQRVNLLRDLETLFQHQFEKEYGRMASL